MTRNEAGVASEGFILKIDKANLPDPPINIRVVEVHPHNIHLRWDAPPKTIVSGYIVHFLILGNVLEIYDHAVTKEMYLIKNVKVISINISYDIEN